MAVTAEECLPAALDQLYAAVAALVDPRKELVDGQLYVEPSLYEQLVAAIPAAATQQLGRRFHRSVSPVWVDAVDLQRGIDDTVKGWQPEGDSTPERLRVLAAGKWRPQDTRDLQQRAGLLESWAVQINSLLFPQHVKHVSAPCPACGATTVYRRDSGGDMVRIPALQLVAETGCTCQACKHTWLPHHYLLLSKVLGLDAPAGVIG